MSRRPLGVCLIVVGLVPTSALNRRVWTVSQRALPHQNLVVRRHQCLMSRISLSRRGCPIKSAASSPHRIQDYKETRSHGSLGVVYVILHIEGTDYPTENDSLLRAQLFGNLGKSRYPSHNFFQRSEGVQRGSPEPFRRGTATLFFRLSLNSLIRSCDGVR